MSLLKDIFFYFLRSPVKKSQKPTSQSFKTTSIDQLFFYPWNTNSVCHRWNVMFFPRICAQATLHWKHSTCVYLTPSVCVPALVYSSVERLQLQVVSGVLDKRIQTASGRTLISEIHVESTSIWTSLHQISSSTDNENLQRSHTSTTEENRLVSASCFYCRIHVWCLTDLLLRLKLLIV